MQTNFIVIFQEFHYLNGMIRLQKCLFSFFFKISKYKVQTEYAWHEMNFTQNIQRSVTHFLFISLSHFRHRSFFACPAADKLNFNPPKPQEKVLRLVWHCMDLSLVLRMRNFYESDCSDARSFELF